MMVYTQHDKTRRDSGGVRITVNVNVLFSSSFFIIIKSLNPEGAGKPKTIFFLENQYFFVTFTTKICDNAVWKAQSKI